jgi:hypothetical protein
MEEIWRLITSVGGKRVKYQVSNLGKIRSSWRSRSGVYKVKNLSTCMYKGELCITLRNQGIPRCYTVARLVAEAFVPKPEGAKYVRHINDDVTDNRADNLKWETVSISAHSILKKIEEVIGSNLNCNVKVSEIKALLENYFH